MFPQVITRIIDNSQIPEANSRFRGGIVGVCSRGPFNEIVSVPTLNRFLSVLGPPVTGSYVADAVGLIAKTSDGSRVVRIGAQYSEVSATNTSGDFESYSLISPNANLVSADQYVRVQEPGKESTVNARVLSSVGSTVTLVSSGAGAVALADDYVAATLSVSDVANAANAAEAFLTAPTYDAPLSGLGTVTGNKGEYVMEVSGDETEIAVGDVLKITQAGRATTREIRVKEVRADKKIFFETNNRGDIGYQALPLQANYTGATVAVVDDPVGQTALHLEANTAGTWANTSGNTGLIVRVSPGSKPDTKKLLVYYNNALVETIDNLSSDSASDDYYETRINDKSSYVTVKYVFSEAPGNTAQPWNTALASPANNASFSGGFNGENVTDADYIGSVNPADNSATGLKLFDDKLSSEASIDTLVCPGVTSTNVFNEMARIAGVTNCEVIADIPDNLNYRQATDWHNGAGLYSANGSIDNFRLSYFWNWWEGTSPATGERSFMPPTLGVLRATARTFDEAKPWYVAAGETRGRLEEALDLRFRRYSLDDLNAGYGEGNSINPILLINRQILVYGNRSAQRSETRLTSRHNVILTNVILQGFSRIARRFTFDPIDDVLYQQLRLEYTAFMEAVKSERGVEKYELTLDGSNNTDLMRDLRQVAVDIAFIPTNAAETFIITATVERSGAQLTSIA